MDNIGKITYDPLWKMLDNLKITKMEFAQSIGISKPTMAKMGKNEPVTLTVIMKICQVYNCDIENVVMFIRDEKRTVGVRKWDIVRSEGSNYLVVGTSEYEVIGRNDEQYIMQDLLTVPILDRSAKLGEILIYKWYEVNENIEKNYIDECDKDIVKKTIQGNRAIKKDKLIVLNSYDIERVLNEKLDGFTILFVESWLDDIKGMLQPDDYSY